MAEIEKRKKALSVSPLKSSQTIGAALAFLGVKRSIPMLHGSQGCTAFGKVFFVRHFREPIPLQTTAMDQVSTVMGADDNVVEGLKAICEKSGPEMIGLPTTGLAETQGCDVPGAIKAFRDAHPEFDHVTLVPVNTPDYAGCFETGYAKAVKAMIEELVPDTSAPAYPYPRRVNVLAGAHLTPGDLEELKEIIESFGLNPVVFPDLSDSLDGRLTASDFDPLTIGGAEVPDIRSAGKAAATLVIGASLNGAADELARRTNVTDFRFDHLMGLDEVDRFVDALREISGRPVPAKLERQRAQLQDAMLDTHFMLGMTRAAVAGDPDLLHAFTDLLTGMGARVVAAVAPANAPVLRNVKTDLVKIGDLEELERLAREGDAEIIIGNSHAVESAARLGLPILRAGFPQYDLLGGYQRTWIGYRGTRQTLFDLANILLEQERGEIEPYRSIYAQKPEYLEEGSHADATATADRGLPN
jgi:nitrogenase molybdenum-iron protein NifN